MNMIERLKMGIMKKISVQRARIIDLDWINSAYDEIGFVQSNYENEYIVIAMVDNDNAGMGRLVVIDDQHIELGGIYVLPKYRGLGIAKTIVQSLCRDNPFDKSFTIWCLPFEHLVPFYSIFGFSTLPNIPHPKDIEKKLTWCNTDNRYEKKVVLLHKKNIDLYISK